MLARTQKVYPPRGARLIAVSDIHAHRSFLEGLLKKINFCADDVLFIVGDMVERGPDSLGTLRLVMRLCSQGNAYALPGNMDLWSLSFITGTKGHTGKNVYEYARDMLAWHGGNLFCEMCREAGIAFSEDIDIPAAQRELAVRFKPEIDFLNSLPCFVETPDYIFVHGGLPGDNPRLYDYQNVIPFLKNDSFIDKGLRFKKYVIVGHWPTRLYRPDYASSAPYIAREQRIIDIDGGVGLKDDAQLNALFLPNGGGEDFSWTSYDELEQVQALDAQVPSENPFNLRWCDSSVDILGIDGDIARVRHVSTGREMDVPKIMLYEYTPGKTRCRCDDISDYRLPVAPGDVLSVVRRTSRGIIAKKGDVSGWYMGRVAEL